MDARVSSLVRQLAKLLCINSVLDTFFSLTRHSGTIYTSTLWQLATILSQGFTDESHYNTNL